MINIVLQKAAYISSKNEHVKTRDGSEFTVSWVKFLDVSEHPPTEICIPAHEQASFAHLNPLEIQTYVIEVEPGYSKYESKPLQVLRAQVSAE